MAQRVTRITLLVSDQEEALQYYTHTLHFKVVEDYQVNPAKRWLVVAPPGPADCAFILAKATTESQLVRVGDQTGGKVLVVLQTDTFDADLINLQQKAVKIIRGPVMEEWGRVVVFEDKYGNLWDLVGR